MVAILRVYNYGAVKGSVQMKEFLKKISSKLPKKYQQELKRFYFARQIRNGTFVTDEKEFGVLEEWVHEGDWVIDVGANIGHYSRRLSELVGKTGRVIVFEPVPETFELLSANMANLNYNNYTLFNVAASDSSSIQGMTLPKHDTGLDNYFMAKITQENPAFEILCLPIDSLNLPRPITLAKIDAEGHDIKVLKGMGSILSKDHPVLIIEEDSPEIDDFLAGYGYSCKRIDGSHNRIFY